jgi:precorrin-6B methylase 1
MPTSDHLILRELIPDPDDVRRRLAVVLTEADLLRSQLRVSERLTRERERLRRQQQEQGVSLAS